MPEVAPVTMYTRPERSGSVEGWKGMLVCVSFRGGEDLDSVLICVDKLQDVCSFLYWFLGRERGIVRPLQAMIIRL
jgi:hypothetical protein